MAWLARRRLEHELGAWRRLGHTPRLWWRDDDARKPTAALDRLLEAANGTPIALAIIPDGDLPALAKRLNGDTGVTVSQHGIDHQNRLPEGGRRSEYAEGTSQDAVNAAIARGRDALKAAGFDPRFYTPTWNEFDDRLLTAVRAAGYLTFSAGIKGYPTHGLKHLGADVDVLRWKEDPPQFKGEVRILDLLRKRLEERRRARRYGEPIGMLTHHLVHDEPTWAFLNWFVGYSKPRFSWCNFTEGTG
jgi:hypothetical protein